MSMLNLTLGKTRIQQPFRAVPTTRQCWIVLFSDARSLLLFSPPPESLLGHNFA